MASGGKDIIGYFHVCQKGEWRKSFDLIFDEIKKSGLYDATKEIRCVVVNDTNEVIRDERLEDSKIVVIQGGDSTQYERVTLLEMHKASQGESCNYWYFHTKGLKHFNTPTEECVIDWIRFMVYWNVTHWDTAVEYLKIADVYGCNYMHTPVPHYSGNFWWATSEYIRNLPGYIGDEYCDPEFWVFKAYPVFKNIYRKCTGYIERFKLEENDMTPL